ncbi:hypothetical protein L209DRAFT_79126 [Thermothelomyces heterothallicus CBS 203.75]
MVLFLSLFILFIFVHPLLPLSHASRLALSTSRHHLTTSRTGLQVIVNKEGSLHPCCACLISHFLTTISHSCRISRSHKTALRHSNLVQCIMAVCETITRLWRARALRQSFHHPKRLPSSLEPQFAKRKLTLVLSPESRAFDPVAG